MQNIIEHHEQNHENHNVSGCPVCEDRVREDLEAARGPVAPGELAAFVTALSAKINALGHAEFPDCPWNWQIVESMPGKKYARLVTKTEDTTPIYRHNSAYCFIDLTNGDILKAASWNAPAKQARGNIRVSGPADWWNGALTKYGAAYLK